MDELLLEGVVASRLDNRLREGAAWDNCTLIARPHAEACSLQLKLGNQVLVDTLLQHGSEVFRTGGGSSILIGGNSPSDTNSLLLIPCNSEETTQLWALLVKVCRGSQLKEEQQKCAFNLRTDESSATHYFQWYGHLCQQQNMLQDYIRTATYQSAFLQNCEMFRDKVVLDVGTGSGILSFFAIQAGARHVYAVDASNITTQCQQLVNSNGLTNRITVINGRMEEVTLPEKVDLLISEPFGYMLYNERMLETYLHAKKWLKPGGHMMPTQGDLYVAPFTDEILYMEQTSKSQFWQQKAFYSLDLSSLRQTALLEYFSQPIVDTFDARILMARPFRFSTNFETAHESDLYKVVIPLDFELINTGIIHGLAFWFEIGFMGTSATVWLSTAPHQPLTHWYQVRCLLQTPLLAYTGEHLTGTVVLNANERQSYDVNIQVTVGVGPNKRSSGNVLDLKNPYFRYTGVAPAPPPGSYNDNQTEQLWNNLGLQANKQVAATSTAHLQTYTNPPMSYGLTMNPAFSGMSLLPQQQQQMMVMGGAVSNVGVAEPPKQ